MNNLEKYYIVKFAAASYGSTNCGPSGCGSMTFKPKADSTPKVVSGTGYGPNRDRAPVTHKVPDQRPPATNMTRHQTRTMSDLYSKAVRANPGKYQNVPFRQLEPSRQLELLNAYQNKTPVSPYVPSRNNVFTGQNNAPQRPRPRTRPILL